YEFTGLAPERHHIRIVGYEGEMTHIPVSRLTAEIRTGQTTNFDIDLRELAGGNRVYVRVRINGEVQVLRYLFDGHEIRSGVDSDDGWYRFTGITPGNRFLDLRYPVNVPTTETVLYTQSLRVAVA